MHTKTRDPRSGRSAIGFRVGCCALAAVVALRTTPVSAEANELSYSLGADAEYSDNIGRSPDFAVADTTLTAETQLNLKRQTRRLDTLVNADFAYDKYLHDTFDPQVRGNGLANLEAQILENHVAWFAGDNFGQLQLNNLTPDTPLNRENVNTFSTGPRLAFDLGRRTQLRLDGSYEVDHYEKSPLDAKRTTGDLSLRRDITLGQFLELTASTDRTRFDQDALLAGYDVHEYYLTWSAKGAKTQLLISAGQSVLTQNDRENSGFLLRFDAHRRVGRFGALSLVARSQSASTIDAFRFEQTATAINLGVTPLAATAEPFSFKYVSLDYELNARRLRVSFGGSAERDRYHITRENDRDRDAARIGFDWISGPAWTVDAGLQLAREDFVVAGANFREVEFSAGAGRRLTRDLQLRLGVSRFARSGVVGTNAYHENRAMLSITYYGGRTRALPGSLN